MGNKICFVFEPPRGKSVIFVVQQAFLDLLSIVHKAVWAMAN